MEKHNVLEIDALTLENMVVAHIEQRLPMCNVKLEYYLKLAYRSPKTFSIGLSPKLVNPLDFHQLR